MNSVIKNEFCCGCMVCEYICPTKAITTQINDEGFKEPDIDLDKCIKCGKCEKNCSINNIQKQIPIVIYAAKYTNLDILKQSSSGGVFYALGLSVLEEGGLVYGTAFTESFEPEFMCAHNLDEMHKLMGSKYVQSYIEGCYIDIKREADSGINMLITGTPCQINAIKKFLSKDYQNILFVDIVCHGVPSPQIWRDYLAYFKQKKCILKDTQIESLNFRDKQLGWKKSFASCKIDNKKVSIQEYMMLYGEASIIRKSCYHCPFSTKERISDLTIGDFWGIENIDSNCFFEYEGTSMIMINTEKGRRGFEKIKDKIDYKEFDIHIPLQQNLQRPTERPKRREDFWKLYNEKGFEKVINRYGGAGLYGKIRKMLGKVKRKIKK